MPDTSDRKLVSATIAMAHELDMKVIAEGVETPEQLQFLRDNGCPIIQGFYFSKPLDINAFSAYLNSPSVTLEEAIL